MTLFPQPAAVYVDNHFAIKFPSALRRTVLESNKNNTSHHCALTQAFCWHCLNCPNLQSDRY